MHRFLIVDDDPAGLRLISRFLAPYGQCDLADHGHEAISLFRQGLETGHGYDLVCLDIMMPGLDGHAVLQSLRQLESEHGVLGSSGVKVLMLSATSDTKHCVRAFTEGCEAYIAKPLNKNRLLAEVELLLGPLQPIAEGETKQGDASRPARYLIVDDEPTNRHLLAFLLAPYADCEQADNGETAIMLFRDALESGSHFDLVCLDILMPGFDGFTVLQIMRRMETEYGVFGNDTAKVLMISTANDAKSIVRAFGNGCEAYLARPFEKQDLLARLEHLGLLTKVASSQ
jgi:two-component system chemotaxis response regulator CheY